MGTPSDPNGRLLVTSSISSIGTNSYRLTVNLAVKSSLTFNEYGINCYAHIGSSKIHLGTFIIKQNSGVCTPNTYTRDFTVTSNTEVYASCICTHCNGSDGWTGTSNSDIAYYTNPNSAPPAPGIFCLNYAAPGRYLLEKTLDAELSQVSDPDGDTVRYVLYAQYKSPGMSDWASAGDVNNCILYSTTDRRVSINIEKYPRGTQFRIWGKAEDATHGVSSPNTGTIDNIYRKQAPTAPTMFCMNDQFNSDYIVETVMTLKLSDATDPENIGSTMQYRICGQYKTPGSNQWLSMAGSDNIIASSQSATIRIEDYERGTQFKVWGYAIDNLGAQSENSNTMDNILRNRKPNKITTINPVSKTIIGNSITISWNIPTDPDGQTLTYSISIKVNDEDYFLLDGGKIETSFTVDISNYDPGTEFRFKVIPNDGMVDGDGTISPLYKKDFPPSFILPVNNSTLFQTNPRMVAKKMKGTGVHLYVSHDSISFNSNTNASRFRENVKTLSDGISMCFNPTLTVGKKTAVTIYSTHNGFESSRVTIEVTINSLSVDLTDSIKKTINDNLLNSINKIRQAYNLQTITGPTITASVSKVAKAHITQMTNALDVVRNAVNEYDTNKISTTWNNNSDNIIRKSDFQQVVDAIGNV